MPFCSPVINPIMYSLRAGVIALAAHVSPAIAEDTFSFGVVPQFEARKLSAIWTPIIQELESRVNAEFRMLGSPRIPEFEQAFVRGEFDFAYMNPYHSLVASQTQGYEPLVRDGDRQLFGVLVVRKDSPYQNVRGLTGKKIAFPAPNALGASLLMRADLDRQFQLRFQPEFVNTHASAYLSVVLGESAAAGGVMGTFRSLDPSIKDQLRIIYETTRMPPHPIMVHPRVPSEIASAVQKAFIEMAATQEGEKLLARIPMLRAIEADVSDYQILRSLKLESYYVDTSVN